MRGRAAAMDIADEAGAERCEAMHPTPPLGRDGLAFLVDDDVEASLRALPRLEMAGRNSCPDGAQRMVGMTKSAPFLMPVGQRVVMVFRRV